MTSANEPQKYVAACCQECGHSRELHISFERLGGCNAKLDKRPINVGGPELHPCECKRFVPAFVFGGAR